MSVKIVRAGLVACALAFCVVPKPDHMSSVAMVSDTSGHGSGVFIAKNIVITARHVVDDKHTGKVDVTQIKVNDDSGSIHHVTDVKISETTDFAMLTLDKDADVTPSKVDCTMPQIMTVLKGVGYPLDLGKTTVLIRVAGYVTLDHFDYGKGKVFITDGTIIPGDSGGPVFSDTGVIGLMDGMLMMPSNGETPDFSPSGLDFITPLITEPMVCPHPA